MVRRRQSERTGRGVGRNRPHHTSWRRALRAAEQVLRPAAERPWPAQGGGRVQERVMGARSFRATRMGHNSHWEF